MTSAKITALSSMTHAEVDSTTDLVEIVDVSDTTLAATGTNKKITVTELLGEPGIATAHPEMSTETVTTQDGDTVVNTLPAANSQLVGTAYKYDTDAYPRLILGPGGVGISNGTEDIVSTGGHTFYYVPNGSAGGDTIFIDDLMAGIFTTNECNLRLITGYPGWSDGQPAAYQPNIQFGAGYGVQLFGGSDASGSYGAIIGCGGLNQIPTIVASFQSDAATINTPIDLPEESTPANPAANTARLFARDNGAGKTQLCVLFPTGSAVVLATQA